MAIKKIGTIVNFFGLKGQLKVSVSSSQAEERFKVRRRDIPHHLFPHQGF